MADTHCHKHNEENFNSSPCLDCKSEVKITGLGCSSKLENAVNKFVERRGDLAERQRYLKDKVSTMERSIPALMAFNMWMSGQKCQDAPLCKIREIMNKFSPYPDPTEKLLQNLQKTVEDLNQEISELHERIIAADVDLEEKGMEVESLELSNKEMDTELKTLEKEISAGTSLSLHSIHSDDLVCLSRIRQLGEEERSLKCCIKQLEEKEMAYRQQMESLLISKEFQNSSDGQQMCRRLKELETSDKKLRCTHQTQKYNMHQMKKKLVEKDQKLAKFENQSGIKTVNQAKNSDKKSCSCSSRPKLESSKRKVCVYNPLCQPPLKGKNPACPPLKDTKRSQPLRKSGCRCSCKGKCAQGISESPCNCGTELKSNYDPPGNQNLVESSDDEFCECDCGCKDEDVPGACLQSAKNRK